MTEIYGREIYVEQRLVVQVDYDSPVISERFPDHHDLSDFLRELGELYSRGEITGNPNQQIMDIGTIGEMGAKFRLYDVGSKLGWKATVESPYKPELAPNGFTGFDDDEN